MSGAREAVFLPDDRQEGQLKQLEFQSIYDLSLAITRNKPEEGLLRILENYLLESLGISHFTAFNLEDGHWTNSFCYGKMVAGWKSLPLPGTNFKPQLLSEILPELEDLNPHIHWLIPYHFDGHPGGMILCQKPEALLPKNQPEAISLLQTLFGLMMMARENQKLLAFRLRQESLKKEMEIARQVQKMLFPRNLPDSENLKAYATYLPHQEVSGDYYDFIPLSNGDFAFCVADVSGKGIPAALLMSNFQASLRTLMMDFKNLDEIIFRLNRLICRNSRGERFITAFVGLYKSAEKKLVYINCGHLPPLLFSASGSVVSLRTGSTVLGIFDELPKLQAGSEIVNGPVLLVAFTDGLAEVVDSTGEEFGDERLEQYFAENRNEKMAVMHQRLLNRLDNFSGDQGFGDDLTLLTIRFGGE